MISASDLPVGSKSAPPFAPPIGRPVKRFEDLFEAQEFNDAGIYVFLEAKTAFVRPDCTVKLEAVACIRMIVAGIVLPYDAEGELSFRYDQAVQQVEFFIFRMFFYNRFQRRQYFFYGLDEFRFVSIFRTYAFDN